MTTFKIAEARRERALPIFLFFLIILAGMPGRTDASKPHIDLSTSTATLTREDILNRFLELDKTLVTLSAKFVQSLDMAVSGISREVEGTLRYKKPSSLRLEHHTPERQTVVSDGKWIWIHRHSTRQAIQADFDTWKKSDPLAQSLLEFGKFSQTLKKYDIALDTSPVLDLQTQTTAYTMILTPKKKSQEFTLMLKLSAADSFPVRSVLRTGDLTVQTTFVEVQLNPKLKSSIFKELGI